MGSMAYFNAPTGSQHFIRQTENRDYSVIPENYRESELHFEEEKEVQSAENLGNSPQVEEEGMQFDFEATGDKPALSLRISEKPE